MILLGAWMALIGYGVAYAGVSNLGGAKCKLHQAFSRDGCQPSATATSTTVQPGVTQAEIAQAQAQQQATLLPGTVLV